MTIEELKAQLEPTFTGIVFDPQDSDTHPWQAFYPGYKLMGTSPEHLLEVCKTFLANKDAH